MKRRSFVLGALSAGIVSVIAAKSEPKSAFAEEVSPKELEVYSVDDSIKSVVRRFKTDNGWDEYLYHYDKGIIESAYYTPAKGSVHSRMVLGGDKENALRYNIGTMDMIILSTLDRTEQWFEFVTPIGLNRASTFNKRVQDFFEQYVMEYNPNYPTLTR